MIDSRKPACAGMTEVYFGPNVDGRKEQGREVREQHARHICLEHCELTMRCLERAMVVGEQEGVWGGMSEADRRKFQSHLRSEGYDTIPSGMEFWAALNSYWRQRESAEFERHGRSVPA